jgi:hypothetical protein
MKTLTLKGQVYDPFKRKTGGGYFGIPSAKVFVSDEDGKLTAGKFGAIADINGNFTLNLPMVDPLGTGAWIPNIDGKYLTATDGIDSMTVEITPQKGTTYNFGLKPKAGIQEVQEATVTVDSAKTRCQKSGGQYDEANRRCVLPQKDRDDCVRNGGTWDEANKRCVQIYREKKLKPWHWALIALGVTGLAVGTYFVVKKYSK